MLGLAKRIGEIKIVKESLDLFRIAAHVYKIHKDDLNEEKSTNKPFEVSYFQACTFVTHKRSEETKGRVDYRAIEFFFKNLRESQRKSNKIIESILHNVSITVGKFVKAASNTKENAVICLKYAVDLLRIIKNKIDDIIQNGMVEIFDSFACYAHSFHTMAANLLNSQLIPIWFNTLKPKYTKLREFIAFSLLINKNKIINLYNVIFSKLDQHQLSRYLKRTITNDVIHIKDTYFIATRTVKKNEVSLSRLSSYLFSHLSASFTKNKNLLVLLISENWILLKTFFRDFDFEVYYSPRKSFKIIEDVRTIVAVFSGEKKKIGQIYNNKRMMF